MKMFKRNSEHDLYMYLIECPYMDAQAKMQMMYAYNLRHETLSNDQLKSVGDSIGVSHV